jgi:hypothetical protein
VVATIPAVKITTIVLDFETKRDWSFYDGKMAELI